MSPASQVEAAVAALAISFRAPGITPVLEAYETVTAPLGLRMVLQSDLVKNIANQAATLQVLDNAAGAGAVANIVVQLSDMKRAPTCDVIAADKDNKCIDQMEIRKAAAGPSWARVTPQQFDMQAPPFDADTFDFVFSNLGVFFAEDDVKVLDETLRILRPGGQAGYSSWQTIAWWPMLQSALAEAIPEAPSLPGDSFLFPKGYNDPIKVAQKLKDAGYVDISTAKYEYSVDVSAELFAKGIAPLVSSILPKLWGAETAEKLGGKSKVQQAVQS